MQCIRLQLAPKDLMQFLAPSKWILHNEYKPNLTGTFLIQIPLFFPKYFISAFSAGLGSNSHF